MKSKRAVADLFTDFTPNTHHTRESLANLTTKLIEKQAYGRRSILTFRHI